MLLNLLLASWRLLRFKTYLLMLIYLSFAVSVAAYYIGIGFSDLVLLHSWRLVGIALAIGLWYVSGTAINDFIDYDIDKHNLPNDKDRPAVQKLVDRTWLLGIALASAAFCLLLIATLQSPSILLLFLVVTVLNVVYSAKPIQLSHRGILGPLLLPIGYVLLPVLSVYLVVGVFGISATSMAAIGLYIHFFSRIILKDFRDVKGDKKFGKKTALLQLGQKVVCYVSAIAFAVSTGILVYSLDAGHYWYLWASALGYGLMVIYILSKQHAWEFQKIAIMVFGRICTMTIVLITFIVMAHTENLQLWRIYIVVAAIAAAFLYSINKIYHSAMHEERAG